MRKGLYFIHYIMLFTIFFINSAYCAVSADSINTNNIITDDSKSKLENDLLLRFSSPYIDSAIENYYGEPRQFDLWDAKIISIKRFEPESFNFETTISVTTFKGPHNPPYGLEVVTIRIDGNGIHVVNFKHKAVSYFSFFTYQS